jgi:hypothetical protein
MDTQLYLPVSFCCVALLCVRFAIQHGKAARKARRKGLFSDPEFFDQLAITGQVVLLQVIEQAFALSYQLHQPAVSGEVFFVLLQVTRNLGNPFCEKRDLSFNGPRIRLFAAKLFEN